MKATPKEQNAGSNSMLDFENAITKNAVEEVSIIIVLAILILLAASLVTVY